MGERKPGKSKAEMELWRIGEIAAAAAVSTRTVDYYTSLGLIAEADRTSGNYRLYDKATVERITAVRRLEASGVKLEDIAAALAGAGAASALVAQLSLVDTDLHHLQVAADTAGADAVSLLTAITARVHSLITTALELVAGMPPPPL